MEKNERFLAPNVPTKEEITHLFRVNKTWTITGLGTRRGMYHNKPVPIYYPVRYNRESSKRR